MKWNEKLGLIIAESGNVWTKWIRLFWNWTCASTHVQEALIHHCVRYPAVEKHGNLASTGPIDMSVDLTDSSDKHFRNLITRCTVKCCGINLFWIWLLDDSMGHPCTQLTSLPTASTPAHLIKRIRSYVFGFRPGIDVYLLIFRSHIYDETHLNLHPFFLEKGKKYKKMLN